MSQRSRRRFVFSVTATVSIVVAASSAGATTRAVAPVAARAVSVAPYARVGPYAVGFTQLKLAGGRRVVVWYPAKPGQTAGHAQESIDIAGFLSPALQKRIPAKYRVKYTGNAYADAPSAPAKGGYPVVIFSHGFAGYPEQSLDITTHLASWGFVVAAPDHVERSLDGLLGIAAKGVPKMTDVAVLQATLDLVVTSSNATGLLHGLANANEVVASGHSAGAGAAYSFASADPRVKAWISYSVGFGGQGGPAPSAPTKPGMVMLGTTDGVIPPASSVQVYDGMHSPKYLVKIARAGHLVFSDICLIGRSFGGITAIAKLLKLPIPASFLKLGSDGCTSDHPPVQKAFPAIDQLTVAFFRSALHIDATPVGLNTKAVTNLGASVTVTSG